MQDCENVRMIYENGNILISMDDFLEVVEYYQGTEYNKDEIVAVLSFYPTIFYFVGGEKKAFIKIQDALCVVARLTSNYDLQEEMFRNVLPEAIERFTRKGECYCV